jgi:alkylhydroperoxidase family enzyme
MRLPYIKTPVPTTTAANAAIVERITARRAPRPLQALDLTLLHSPAVADGWNSFLGAVRTGTTLTDDIREIAICRVAVHNGATYEWNHHAPLAAKGGVTEEGMKLLAKKDVGEGWKKEGGEGLNEKQWAVLRFADASTVGVRVSEEIFGEARRLFSEQEVVEITATVCSNLNSHLHFGLLPLWPPRRLC